ncbi:MAG: hypothetical protein U9R58_06165 [Chloroflexota bacterium]|nr:hypothetical protein [Chloroflexota bacterium]
MKKKMSLLLPIFLGLGLFIACNQNHPSIDEETRVSTPSISLYDLLLTIEDMPESWVGYPPFKSPDSLCYFDCVTVQFDAQTDGQSRATHDIYVYKSATEAKRSFEKQVLPLIGETPPRWDYVSEFADQSDFACYTYAYPAYPNCEWTARYDRYIVVFYSWLVPEKMTFNELEDIIRVIESKMSIVISTNNK